MPTRHEKDMAYTILSMEDFASQFGLTEEEEIMMHTMDKRFPEIADYRGYPELQAEWIVDHRNIIQERLALGSDYLGFVGSVDLNENTGAHEEQSSNKVDGAMRVSGTVIHLARRETSVDLASTG
jgi:hypothetical protein